MKHETIDYIYGIYNLCQKMSLNIWLSLSFGVLGTVLLYRRFDWYYGCFCLIISALGCWYPLALIFPYFLVVWRVLIGRNIKTDSPLFIGERNINCKEADEQHSTSSGSNSLSHWIVAVRVPADHDNLGDDSYLMAHAVDEDGPVISGFGKGLKFRHKSKTEVEEKYQLHHVGWVTRKQREYQMSQVVENEPMASGYSCQEFAVDIAFQVSSSRTYTYIKSLTLIRLRAMIYYSLAIFSAIVYLLHECFDQPVVVFLPLNPDMFNPATVTNLFIATEAYRIGYTNVRRESLRNWKKGLSDRLHVYVNTLPAVDKFKLLLLLPFCIALQIWIENIMLTISIMMVCIFMAN